MYMSRFTNEIVFYDLCFINVYFMKCLVIYLEMKTVIQVSYQSFSFMYSLNQVNHLIN